MTASFRYSAMRKFFRIMGARPIHIMLPAFISFLAASFDGISIGLLVPLVKGVVSNSFDFIKDVPCLRYIIRSFPHLLSDTTTPNRNAFLFLIGLIFLSVIFKNTLNYINSILSAYWHGRFKRNIYKFVFNRFLDFGKMFFDRTSFGYLMMVLNYSDYVMSMLRVFELSVDKLFTLAVYFVIMMMISWKLTLVTMLVFPMLHYSLRFIISRISRIAKLINKSKIRLYKNVFNILSCIPLIKAYSKEDQMKEDYNRINEELRKLDLRSVRMERLITPIQEVIVTLALLFMVAMVALLFAKGKPAEISVFVVFFYAARRSLPMFNIFNYIKSQFAQARPPIKELWKIFDDAGKFYVPDGTVVFEGLRDRIEFKGLDFSYVKDMPVLKNLSFSIEKGRTTAIVGPSGAGKTSIISLIMRFYDFPPGSIFIDGIDIRDYTLKSLRGHISFVSQETLLFNDSIRRNMIFGLDRYIGDEELNDVANKVRLYEFISSLPRGFDTEIGERGVKLSGGEKQRLSIARALLKKSEIFILDEATSSLDSNTEKLIQEAIDEAVKGRTAIIIAHRLSTIKHADKIIVIENGQCVEDGSMNELLNIKGRFYQYWEAQKFY
jgi:ATP-binding cassette, subfamily B, bacterial MsbA